MAIKPQQTAKTRARGLKSLIRDGLAIGFSSSLIGCYKGQLKEIEGEINEDKARQQKIKKGLSPFNIPPTENLSEDLK